MITNRRLAYLVAFGLVGASSACGGDGLTLPSESRAAEIAIVSGDGQSGSAGAPLTDPLVVRVTDALSRPVEGQAVAFTIDAGGGTVAPTSVLTDAGGLASARWTLGPAAGSQRLQALVQADGQTAPLVVSFTASAGSGAGAALVQVSGDNQTAPVGSALADSLVVRVTDAFDNPVAGVDVQWTVDGGGSISPTTVTTGADGLAAAERVLGNAAGTQTAQASAAGVTPVGFTQTAVAANPTVLRVVSGDGQTGSVGSPLADPLVVRLEDPNGNGVGGKAITFVVGPNAGSADPVNATTDPNGLASTVWTLGSSVGPQTLNAIYSGLPPVAFNATAAPATPTQLVFTRPPQITAAGASFSPSIQVSVEDAGGNTVTSATNAVTLAIGTNPAGGTLSGTLTVNAVNGVASFANVSIDNPGTGYTLTASADGLTGATSPAFDIVPVQVATNLTITSDQPDYSLVGQPVVVTWNFSTSGTAAVTGNITVTVNGTADSCSAPAAFGSGTCTLPISNNGSRRLTASFGGDANYRSASDNEAHQVKGTTSTSVASSANPATVGQSVTLTAQVAATSGSGIPGGSVQFFDGATSLGTDNLDAAGSASVAVSFLLLGDHTITAAYQGSSTFEVSTSDPFTQQVNPLPNTAPTADNDAYDVNEDETLNVSASSGVLNGDIDLDGDPLTAVLETGPTNAADFTLNADGSFTYTPAANFNGDDSFTYHASDGSLNSGTATVTITVAPVNDAPTAVDDPYTVAQDGSLSVDAATGVLANDTDPESDLLTAGLDTGPANASSFTLNPDGSFTYVPTPGFSGTDNFTYHANDGNADSNTVTVTITVTAP